MEAVVAHMQVVHVRFPFEAIRDCFSLSSETGFATPMYWVHADGTAFLRRQCTCLTFQSLFFARLSQALSAIICSLSNK